VLNELRRLDDQVYRIRRDAEKIPQEIDKLNSTLTQKREENLSKKTTLDAVEKQLRTREIELKEREDKLKKAEEKMMEVKTNEEYQAAQKENEAQRVEKAKLEEEIIVLLNQAEEQRKVFKAIDTEFKSFETAITADLKRLEEERKKLLQDLEKETSKRSHITPQLPTDISSIYMKLADRMAGGSISIVENGLCLGCNMKVRPQLYNEVLGLKAIHRCSNCGRILTLAIQTQQSESA
jgi:predicted  nucleic acid-binding Zn-ribbon protein